MVTDGYRGKSPKITSSQRLLMAVVGRTLEAPCAAQGYPPPAYEWFRKNSDGSLHPLQGLFGNRLLQLEGTLLIREAESHDSGRYLCKVTNGQGEDSAETEILVTAPLSAHVLPESQSVDVGRDASFNCSASGNPVFTIEWLKDGRALRPGPNLSFQNRQQRLRILSVQRHDAGMYQCLVSNDMDNAQGTAQLTLGDYPPTFMQKFQEQILESGGSLSLRCVAQGRPLPQITWFLDGASVPDSGTRLRMGDFVRPGGQVVSYVNISSIRAEDGGQYACIAKNGAGRAKHSARIHVSGPPFIRPMSNKTAIAGDTLEITCPVGGHPIDSILWEKDGYRLPLNDRHKVYPNGTLHILRIEKNSDRGHYICKATNADGRAAENGLYVNVLIRPMIEPFTFPSSLYEGQHYSLVCTVTQGDAPIRIHWTKDGMPLSGLQSVPVSKFSNTLVFESLSPEQRGNYTCLAENRAGRDSHSGTMVIHVPPRWRIEPTDTSAIQGKPISIDCQADGSPNPKIRWTKAESAAPGAEFHPISSSSRLHVFENGSLIVHSIEPDDAGNYLCQASNGVGQGISKMIRLSVHVAAHFEIKFHAQSVRKGENGHLLCEVRGDRPIHITWFKDKMPFGTDQRYDVITTDEGSTLVIRRADRRDSGLYTCVAANTYGADETNIQLMVQEPPDAPTDVRVLELGSRSSKLVWSSSFSGNSPVQQYVVFYKEDNFSDKEQSQNITVPGSESWSFIQGLTPVTAYHSWVLAVNALGKSEPSVTIHFRTEQEAPGGPPQKVEVRAIGAHSLKVTWKPPRKDIQFGAVEGYYVGYREVGSTEFVYKTLGREVEGTQLSGLKRLAEYAVVVQAYNVKGASPPSNQVLVKTLEDDPPASPTVKILFTNSTSLAITWQKIEKVKGYVVHYKWELGEWHESGRTSNESFTLQDLKCGSQYQFYVYAVNTVGKGAPSEVLRTQTEGRAPIAPDKQSLVSVNETCAVVNLSSWLDGGCPIDAFAVRYRQQRQQLWIPATVGQQMTVLLENLSSSTWYRLQVTAYNTAGSTDAEYTFVTNSLNYVPNGPPMPAPPFYQDMTVVVPLAAISLAVLVLFAALVLCLHKTPSSSRHTGVDNYGSVSGKESFPLSEKNLLKKTLSEPCPYYPTPYATTRMSEKEEAARQVLEEPLYATVKRTPRPPRSDFHVYHYPGEMADFFLQSTKGEGNSNKGETSLFRKKEETELDSDPCDGQRKSRYFQR